MIEGSFKKASLTLIILRNDHTKVLLQLSACTRLDPVRLTRFARSVTEAEGRRFSDTSTVLA